ncbi:unnamed protein product [Enterobius vermicularis]|uniref:Uncharacterized protein n=1 Tax=Enterobius vermicularis TaxID=51028 RepID=A0A0N4VQH7_ENTVE|nr:unnamed protein product [Enterobius vermicularis]
MKRSRTVDTNVTDIPRNHSAAEEKTSQKQRWSFAFRRRWFSSTSSKLSSQKNAEHVRESDDGFLVAPARTTLGVLPTGLLIVDDLFKNLHINVDLF